MAKPKLSKATSFPKGLNKSSGKKNPAKIFGSNISPGDKVNAIGSTASWSGSIGTDNKDGSFDVTDLMVATAAKRKAKDKKEDKDKGDFGGGVEDVSVTVTNGTGTSDPFVTPNVQVVEVP